jgi:hypothetical protein
MTNPRLIWKKVERDQALNMTELAHASSYDRGALRAMNLPWQHGKLSLSDFKRILRKRQDKMENARLSATLFNPLEIAISIASEISEKLEFYEKNEGPFGTVVAIAERAIENGSVSVFHPNSTPPRGASASANGHQRQAIADMFYAPSSKRAGKSASRQAQSGPLRSIG